MNRNLHAMTRREILAASGLGVIAAGQSMGADRAAPASPVSIAKCAGYDDDLARVLGRQFDQIGGIGRLVSGKTVAIKLNLTGGGRIGNYTPGQTHWVHPTLVGVCCHLFGRAGAKRIRLLEGAARGDSLEDKMLNAGWDVEALRNAAPLVEFEDTNRLGSGKRYARLKVAKPYIYPAFDLNPSYEDTDVFVSLSKLKHHEECGITLTIKNSFGIAPNSVYGDDAGVDEPNERARRGRESILHYGRRQPPKSAPQEVDFTSDRFEGYRVPRISVDLIAARPVDLAIIDGIESSIGGEGPWVKGVRYAKPEVLIAGRNPVCTDAVATAVMGYNPRAVPGELPFRSTKETGEGEPRHPANPMLLAEAAGIGNAELARIEVLGVPIKQALYEFESRRGG
ncbi:MAG TPA: DUF362 domain-containing protein [Bryobacteraceae bacterium]|nr:DUF362 domain-containing protein [Bryobacteraceae bacterium]